MKKNKLKATAKPKTTVPQNRDECAEMINEIGRLQREVAGVQATMNDEIAGITDNYTGVITEQQQKIKALQDGVQSWCESNRDELTEGGKTKTIGFVTGTVQFRQRPPSVVIRGVDSVLETLERLGLGRFIRTKQEINKEAILNETQAVSGVAGISIKTGVEDFLITPFEQELS